MRTLTSLFAKSPFTPLQSHMSKVMECANKVRELFDEFFKGEFEKVTQIAEEISTLEHTADLEKNDIRNNLPRGLFLPVDKNNLLEILSLQDNLADKCEDIGILLSLKPFKIPKSMHKSINKFLDKSIQSVEMVHNIICKLDELLQSSFAGPEAQKVTEMIDDVALLEHEVDVLQRKLLKGVFEIEDAFNYATFFMMVRSFEALSSLSNDAEKLANRVRMTLDLK
jgi:predicted phosphate transport protein (TIGR00153 family)